MGCSEKTLDYKEHTTGNKYVNKGRRRPDAPCIRRVVQAGSAGWCNIELEFEGAAGGESVHCATRFPGKAWSRCGSNAARISAARPFLVKYRTGGAAERSQGVMLQR